MGSPTRGGRGALPSWLWHGAAAFACCGTSLVSTHRPHLCSSFPGAVARQDFEYCGTFKEPKARRTACASSTRPSFFWPLP